jgi:hypothetical protein
LSRAQTGEGSWSDSRGGVIVTKEWHCLERAGIGAICYNNTEKPALRILA